MLLCLCSLVDVQVFDERTPLDDDAKPTDIMGGPFNKLNWMKVMALAS